MDGTTELVVTLWSAIRASQPAGSNQRISTVLPGSIECSCIALIMRPYTCESGSGISIEVMTGSYDVASAAHDDADRALWLIMTPLARPVVPPVYSRAASDAGSASTIGAGAAASSSAKDSSGTSPPGAAGPTTTMPRTDRTPAAAALTLGRNSGVVMTRTAPLSVSTCRSSSVLSRNRTGVVTAPARQMAGELIPTSGQLA